MTGATPSDSCSSTGSAVVWAAGARAPVSNARRLPGELSAAEQRVSEAIWVCGGASGAVDCARAARQSNNKQRKTPVSHSEPSHQYQPRTCQRDFFSRKKPTLTHQSHFRPARPTRRHLGHPRLPHLLHSYMSSLIGRLAPIGGIHKEGLFGGLHRWIDSAKPPGTTSQTTELGFRSSMRQIVTLRYFFLSPNLVWFTMAVCMHLLFPYRIEAALEWNVAWAGHRLALNFTVCYCYYALFWVGLCTSYTGLESLCRFEPCARAPRLTVESATHALEPHRLQTRGAGRRASTFPAAFLPQATWRTTSTTGVSACCSGRRGSACSCGSGRRARCRTPPTLRSSRAPACSRGTSSG